MVDFYNTLKSSIVDRIRDLSFTAVPNPKGFRQILALMMIHDLIEWTDTLSGESPLRDTLVEIRERMLVSYSDNLHICEDYRHEDRETYIGINLPQTEYTWDRVWDNPDNVVLNDVEEPHEEPVFLSFGGIKDYN